MLLAELKDDETERVFDAKEAVRHGSGVGLWNNVVPILTLAAGPYIQKREL